MSSYYFLSAPSKVLGYGKFWLLYHTLGGNLTLLGSVVLVGLEKTISVVEETTLSCIWFVMTNISTVFLVSSFS